VIVRDANCRLHVDLDELGDGKLLLSETPLLLNAVIHFALPVARLLARLLEVLRE